MVQPFDEFTQTVESMPHALRQVIYSVHNQVQSPLSLITTSLLCSLSSAMQGYVDVRSPYGRVQPVSLFALVVAESGERKSSTDRLLSKPLMDFDREYLNHRDSYAAECMAEERLWKIKVQALESMLKKAMANDSHGDEIERLGEDLGKLIGKKPNGLVTKRTLLNDATPAALFECLSGKNNALTLTSSDAGHQLTRANMDFVSNVNQIWDGEDVVIMRKTGDYTIHGGRLTLSMMIQPQILQRISDGKDDTLRLSGFFSRMLVANPRSVQGYRLGGVQSQENPYLGEYHRRLRTLLNESVHHQTHGERVTLEFSPEAKTILGAFYADVEQNLQPLGGLSDIRDAGSKILDNVARIAALLHSYECGTTQTEIGANIATTACVLGRFYLWQFKALLGEKSVNQLAEEYGRVLHEWLIKNGYHTSGAFLPKSHLLQYAPNKIRRKERLELAIQFLTSTGDIYYYPNCKPSTIQVAPKTWANKVTY